MQQKEESHTSFTNNQFDGFGHSYLNEQDTPNILKMAECGSQAEHLIPSFPTKTYSNHYAIATGLYPSNNGVIDNEFLTKDEVNLSFFQFFFFKTLDYRKNLIKRKANSSKANRVIDWLISDSPPDLAMVYIENPDETGHETRPGNEQVLKSTRTVDGNIRYIFDKLHK
ncbi:hypothetical protein PFISCL1PPCAC_1286, partial [Pristionchus fissidentatus]